MTTYDDIIAYAPIATFLSNRDTITEMPNIVRRAQSYVTERLDHDFFQTTLPLTTISTDGVVDVSPFSGVMEYRSCAAEIRPGYFLPLRKRDIDMLVALYVDQPTGVPQHYAETEDGELTVFPRPFTVINAKVKANVEDVVLSPDAQTNRLSEKLPQLMEQATAMHVALFNLDGNTATLYQGQVGELLTSANAQISRRRRDEVSERPRETRNVMGS